MRRRLWRLRVVAATIALAALAPALHAEDGAERAIRRALGYLQRQQVKELVESPRGVRDFPGDWPQYFELRGAPPLRVRDVSPFTVAFIHHALTQVVEENQLELGLRPRDVAEARAMRELAVEFLRRFESPPGTPEAGTFGFWPYDGAPAVPGPALSRALVGWLGGPVLGGARVPWNLRIFPDELAIPPDADVTATTYASLLDDALVDGGPGTGTPFHELFADWRDLGLVPRRLNPPWLPPASGAFLTWLNYQEHPFPAFPNDVDLVVNANVLYALGRYGRLDTPGVADTVDLVNRVTALGLHRDRFEEIAEYYPHNLVFQYSVSRAYHEGGVTGLAPAVAILADDLEASALEPGDGTAFWDLGDPQLNTAFAIVTLLNAGRDGPLVDRAVEYLVREQNLFGGFDAATFFVARGDNGQVFEFFSAPFTTAMALEALSRARLAP